MPIADSVKKDISRFVKKMLIPIQQRAVILKKTKKGDALKCSVLADPPMVKIAESHIDENGNKYISYVYRYCGTVIKVKV